MKNILAIDSGSTGIRAILFNEQGDIIAREYEKTPAIIPCPGGVEYDPMMLWGALKSVVKKVFENNKNLSIKDVAACGICNARGSFLLWEKATGRPIMNILAWNDVRAADLVKKVNKSVKWLIIRKLMKVLAALTKSAFFTTVSMLNFTTDHASSRLGWYLSQHPDVYERCAKGEIAFGTIDTWFIYQLTGGKVHATDYTNAGATGMYSVFDMDWSKLFFDFFNIPMAILPEVKDTNGDFGMVDPSLFGASFPIRAAVGDQMAACFGHCCFEPGSVKISQGSGAFVDMVVGPKPKVSPRGLYPLMAWCIDGKPTFMVEGTVSTAGTLIDWLGQGIGISDTPKVLNELAAQCEDTEGVFFVPTPAGLRFPYFNDHAKACIFGLSLATHRRHVARAVLEGLALSLYDVIDGMAKDTKTPIKMLKVDGGVSKSDLLLQMLANYANVTVKRAPEADMTATGAAYLAGLGVGVWTNIEQIAKLEKNYTSFEVNIAPEERIKKITQWQKVIKAVLKVYE